MATTYSHAKLAMTEIANRLVANERRMTDA